MYTGLYCNSFFCFACEPGVYTSHKDGDESNVLQPVFLQVSVCNVLFHAPCVLLSLERL